MKIIKEGKSAKQIYDEYKGAKTIINGVYCKIVYNTYEAINPIPPIVELEEGDLIE